MEDTLSFENRNEWRNWLIQNRDKASCVWLIFYKKNSIKRGIALDEAVEEALCFGWIDSKLKRCDEETFILRFSPRKADSVWSKINRERAERLITVGKMTQAGLAKIDEAKKSGQWDKAYSNLELEKIPSDLKDAFLNEPLAWDNFNRFANTYRNLYVGWVNQAKTIETRAKRIKKVVERSLENKNQ